MEKQGKVAQKVVDVVDRANVRICVTLLRYNIDKQENWCEQVRTFARRKEDEKFQQIVYVNYKFDEFIYLFNVMNYVYDNIFTNQVVCNVLQKVISSIYS